MFIGCVVLEVPYSGKFSRKSRFPSRRNFFAVLIFVLRELLTAPLYHRRANRTKDVSWERVGRRLPFWNSAIVPSSDVRSSETNAQNARGKNSRVQIFAVSYFAVLIFAFWSWVAKIAKIYRYTVLPYKVTFAYLSEVFVPFPVKKHEKQKSLMKYTICKHQTCSYQGISNHLWIPTIPISQRL